MEEKRALYIFVTAIFVDLLGPPTAALKILVFLIGLDYFTGVLRAAYERELNSRIGARGIIKKIGYLAAIGLAHQLDLWLGTGDSIRSLSVSLYIANEAWSNAENLASIGIMLPKPVLAKIKDLMGNREVNGADENNRGATDIT